VKKNKYVRGLITIMVVIIGISAAGCFTWKLGRAFVGLVSSGLPEAGDEVNTEEQTLNLPEITFWTCQAGVFENRENAGSQVELLRLRGWKAGIMNEKPYTITIGFFGSKDQALLLAGILVEDGINAWVKEYSFPALHYKVNGNNTEGAVRILNQTGSLLSKNKTGKAKEGLEGSSQEAFSGDFPNDFKELNMALSEIIQTDYMENDRYKYNQDLLDLFLKYKLVTIKYL